MREFPVMGIGRQKFELDRVDYAAPETSGRRGGVQAGWPLWSASWTLGNLKSDMSDEWEALLSSMRGQQRKAFARDVRRPFPKAHPQGFRKMLRTGGAAFDGSAGSWSAIVDGDGECQLTLEDVPSGLRLSRIDYIGFKWVSADGVPGVYDRFALVRASAAARANDLGILTITVEPVVPGIVPADAVAYLDRPGCMMKLTPGTALAEVDKLMKIQGSVIAATQVLEP